MPVENFYNDPRYIELEATRLNGVSEVLTVGSVGSLQAISRSIPNQKEYDLISVYGYPDFLTGPKINNQQIQLISHWSDICNIAESNSQIAGYFRLGLNQDICCADINSIKKRQVGHSVYIDLNQSYDSIFKEFRNNHKRDIKKHRDSYKLIIDNSASPQFHRIYTESMKRLNAETQYYFDEEYFNNLLKIGGTYCNLLYRNDVLAAAAITVKHGNSLFYHLGATGSIFWQEQPLKILLSEIAKQHCNSGISKLILGGGLGGNNDSLMRFKLGFSKLVIPNFAICAVFNETRYREISALGANADLFTNFFPAYRK